MASQVFERFSSPVSKLLRFFVGSRDGWKAKHQAVKAESKLLSNQVRAVEKSRQKWRERAAAAQRRLQELERELEQLKFPVGHA